jgi:hypothetical protein
MSGTQSQPPFTSAIQDPFDVANADNYQQPGFLGVSPDVSRSIAGFGGNLAAAANARTSGGFLANGTGFAGPLGAAITQSQQQGLQRGQTMSDIGYRNAAAQGQRLQNLTAAMNLPLAQAQAQIQYRMLTDAPFRQQMMSGFGMGGTPLSAGTTAAPGSAGGATGDAAVATGDTPQGGSPFYQGISHMESGGNANARNPLSNAAGPAQFMPDTWSAFAKENPQYFTGKSPDEVLAMRTDPQLSATATDWYAAKNAATLKTAGLDATPQNLGVAHAFGGAGATGILKFPDDASLSQVLSVTQPGAVNDILRENPQYGRMTVGDLRQKYAKIGAPSWMAQGGQQAPYQVAQAGNAPLPVPGAQQAQGGAQTATTPSGGMQPPVRAAAPQSAAVQQASDLMTRATQAEQNANALEAQRSAVTAENARRANMAKAFPMMAPYMVPMSMPPGDPAAMRTEASQLRQTALTLQSAGPEALAKSQNTTIDARQGGLIGLPNGQGGYNWVKNPAVETATDANGQQTYVHVSPAMPGSPEGTPGTAEPILDANGKPLIKALPKNLQDARNKSYEDFAGKDTDSYIAAQNTQGWLEQMDHAADTLTKTGGMLNMGPTSPERISFANNVNDILRTAGLPTVFDQNAVASWEELKKATTTAGFELSSHYEGHARQAAATIENATSAVPSATNSPVGFHVVSAGIREASQAAIDAHNYKQTVYDQNGDLNKAEVDFYKTNPPQMYARRAISTVTPYAINSDKELGRYLPGTFVQYKGRVVQVPERQGAPPIPEYLKNAPSPQQLAAANGAAPMPPPPVATP